MFLVLARSSALERSNKAVIFAENINISRLLYLRLTMQWQIRGEGLNRINISSQRTLARS